MNNKTLLPVLLNSSTHYSCTNLCTYLRSDLIRILSFLRRCRSDSSPVIYVTSWSLTKAWRNWPQLKEIQFNSRNLSTLSYIGEGCAKVPIFDMSLLAPKLPHSSHSQVRLPKGKTYARPRQSEGPTPPLRIHRLHISQTSVLGIFLFITIHEKSNLSADFTSQQYPTVAPRHNGP